MSVKKLAVALELSHATGRLRVFKVRKVRRAETKQHSDQNIIDEGARVGTIRLLGLQLCNSANISRIFAIRREVPPRLQLRREKTTMIVPRKLNWCLKE